MSSKVSATAIFNQKINDQIIGRGKQNLNNIASAFKTSRFWKKFSRFSLIGVSVVLVLEAFIQSLGLQGPLVVAANSFSGSAFPGAQAAPAVCQRGVNSPYCGQYCSGSTCSTGGQSSRYIAVLVCDGRRSVCNKGEEEQELNGGSRFDARSVSCGKTVQIDVVDPRYQYDPSNPGQHLLDFTVYYTGDCPTTPPPPPPQTPPTCPDNGVEYCDVARRWVKKTAHVINGVCHYTVVDQNRPERCNPQTPPPTPTEKCGPDHPDNGIIYCDVHNRKIRKTSFWDNNACRWVLTDLGPCGQTPPPSTPPSCNPDPNSCNASAPACGQTTHGINNCGQSCVKHGNACPQPQPQPQLDYNNLQAQQQQQQAQLSNNNNNNTNNINNSNTNNNNNQSSSSSSSSSTVGGSTVVVNQSYR